MPLGSRRETASLVLSWMAPRLSQVLTDPAEITDLLESY